jgi:hypothetical protein
MRVVLVHVASLQPTIFLVTTELFFCFGANAQSDPAITENDQLAVYKAALAT